MLVAASCAPDEPPVDTVGSAITNGIEDDGDNAVVALVANGRAFCTGTLISPSVVVTAGHCIGQRETHAFFGASLAEGGELRAVADQRTHPQFDAISLDHDIGVMLLAEPAPSSVEPSTMRFEALPASFLGAQVRLVGFGVTSVDSPADGGRKRQAMTTVDVLDPLWFEFGSSASQTCMGDSGGPAFMVVDGTDVLVGVTSAGDPQCEQFGRDIRVDPYAADFVVSYADETSARDLAAGERCFLHANCASSTCEFPDDAPTIGYCASPCAADADCPGDMFCAQQDALCRYPAPSPGARDTECIADADCDGRVCAQPQGYSSAVCTAHCLPEIAETCPVASDCIAVADTETTFVCVPGDDLGGCAVGAHPGSNGLLILLALVLLMAPRRRPGSAAAAKVVGEEQDLDVVAHADCLAELALVLVDRRQGDSQDLRDVRAGRPTQDVAQDVGLAVGQVISGRELDQKLAFPHELTGADQRFELVTESDYANEPPLAADATTLSRGSHAVCVGTCEELAVLARSLDDLGCQVVMVIHDGSRCDLVAKQHRAGSRIPHDERLVNGIDEAPK